jgi:hypothetical protein
MIACAWGVVCLLLYSVTDVLFFMIAHRISNGGLNYQIEHHLFPRMSHAHYWLIAPVVREVLLYCNIIGQFESAVRYIAASHVCRLLFTGRLLFVRV